tara:strand:- start:119 stop:676 length:558 start_codon:yes stop_codon:yes gene_type:complete
MSERPLSHTKRGKLLAAAGGLAGGPLGVVISPLILMLINATKKKGNRFLLWFLIGIPISVGLWFFQVFIVIVMMSLLSELSESQTLSNGMDYWSEIKHMSNHKKRPEWCTYLWEQMGKSSAEGIEKVSCYHLVTEEPIGAEFSRTICNRQRDTDPTLSTDFRCRQEVASFTYKEIRKNKKEFGNK